MSPYAKKMHGPLQYTVLIQADPAGRPSAVGTMSPSDCYPVGPAGLYVAGGPVGPDVCFTNPEPVTHTVLVHADPAGHDASAVGTLSPSDCYPAGPAGPYVAGGPVGPDDYLQTLESYEELILDQADPAGQHVVVLDTAESLEDAVLKISWMVDLWKGSLVRSCWNIHFGCWMRPWTVDLLKIYQIGSWRLVRFRMPPWTVNLWRGSLTWSI